MKLKLGIVFCEDVYGCVTCRKRGRTLYARMITEHNYDYTSAEGIRLWTKSIGTK